MQTSDIQTLSERDLPGLLAIKNDSAVHTERLQQQAAGTALYLGAFAGGNLVGFVLLSLENKRDVLPFTNGELCADMIDLLVLPEFRGQGVGTRLVQACEAACRTRGVPYLGLDVNPSDNPGALRLYRRLGYRAVGGLHLDGVYESTDESGQSCTYEDWCVDMLKCL